MSLRYTIRVGRPYGETVQPNSLDYGYSKTLEAARQKAAKLGRNIRSDCRVAIEMDGAIIEQSGIEPFFTGSTCPTSPIQ